MQEGQLMGTAMRLSTSLEALAALAAHLRVAGEEIDVDPRVGELLRAIAAELLGEDAHPSGPATGSGRRYDPDAARTIGGARRGPRAPARLGAHRSADTAGRREDVDRDRGRDRGCCRERPRRAGRASRRAGRGGSSTSGPERRGSRSHGRGGPELRVDGIDVFETALVLARGNDARAAPRIRSSSRSGRHQLGEEAVYDAVWLPLPFLPRQILPLAMSACCAVRSAALASRCSSAPTLGLGLIAAVSSSVDLRTVRPAAIPAAPTSSSTRSRATDSWAPARPSGHGPCPVRPFAGRRPA